MQPVRQMGPTVPVAKAGTATVTTPSSVVLVTNTDTTLAYFYALPTSTLPGAGTGIPVPVGHQIPVSISGSAAFYGCDGGAVSVTPVEMMRSQ